jgi:hypothetical protein
MPRICPFIDAIPVLAISLPQPLFHETVVLSRLQVPNETPGNTAIDLAEQGALFYDWPVPLACVLSLSQSCHIKTGYFSFFSSGDLDFVFLV